MEKIGVFMKSLYSYDSEKPCFSVFYTSFLEAFSHAVLRYQLKHKKHLTDIFNELHQNKQMNFLFFFLRTRVVHRHMRNTQVLFKVLESFQNFISNSNNKNDNQQNKYTELLMSVRIIDELISFITISNSEAHGDIAGLLYPPLALYLITMNRIIFADTKIFHGTEFFNNLPNFLLRHKKFFVNVKDSVSIAKVINEDSTPLLKEFENNFASTFQHFYKTTFFCPNDPTIYPGTHLFVQQLSNWLLHWFISLRKKAESFFTSRIQELLNFHVRAIRSVFFMENPKYDRVLESFFQQGVVVSSTTQIQEIFCYSPLKEGNFSYDVLGKRGVPFLERVRTKTIPPIYYISYETSWPCNLLIDGPVIDVYNRIFQFLFLVKYTKTFIEQLYIKAVKFTSDMRFFLLRAPTFFQFVIGIWAFISCSAQCCLELTPCLSFAELYDTHTQYLSKLPLCGLFSGQRKAIFKSCPTYFFKLCIKAQLQEFIGYFKKLT
ncbi:uncharacterized protein LOC135146013 isoform X2 [Zophobas morio]|uniref:uncharacterized protein LOC135146013 isoform X2 n=1 Tax=Zophobas morio TaxID=2755281 RepID=UPI003083472C